MEVRVQSSEFRGQRSEVYVLSNVYQSGGGPPPRELFTLQWAATVANSLGVMVGVMVRAFLNCGLRIADWMRTPGLLRPMGPIRPVVLVLSSPFTTARRHRRT